MMPLNSVMSVVRVVIVGTWLCTQAESGAVAADGARTTPDSGTALTRAILGRGAAGYLKLLALGADGLPFGSLQDAGLDWHGSGLVPNAGNRHFVCITAGITAAKVLQAIGIASEDGQPYGFALGQHGSWSQPVALPNPDRQPMSDVAMVAVPQCGMQAICIGRTDGQPYLLKQALTSEMWSFEGPVANPGQTPFSRVVCGESNRNEIDVLLIGRDDGQPSMVTLHNQGHPSWGVVESLPNPDKVPYSTAVIGTGSDGYSQVIALGREDGQPYLIWQDMRSGEWKWYGRMLRLDSVRISTMAIGHVANRQRQNMLQVFCIGHDDGQLYRMDHNENGKWQAPMALANPGRTPFAAVTAATIEGNLAVICLDRASGKPYQAIEESGTLTWTTVAALEMPTIKAPPETRPLPPADQRFLGTWRTTDGQRLIFLADGTGTMGNAPLLWGRGGATSCIITYPDGGPQEFLILTSATTARWAKGPTKTLVDVVRDGFPEGANDLRQQPVKVGPKGNDDF